MNTSIFESVFSVMIVLYFVTIVMALREIVLYYRACAKFSASIQVRNYVEHLIATSNDDLNSTLLESRQLIEKDAAQLPLHLQRRFVQGLTQNSIGGRINYTRKILHNYYLPKAITFIDEIDLTTDVPRLVSKGPTIKF